MAKENPQAPEFQQTSWEDAYRRGETPLGLRRATTGTGTAPGRFPDRESGGRSRLRARPRCRRHCPIRNRGHRDRSLTDRARGRAKALSRSGNLLGRSGPLSVAGSAPWSIRHGLGTHLPHRVATIEAGGLFRGSPCVAEARRAGDRPVFHRCPVGSRGIRTAVRHPAPGASPTLETGIHDPPGMGAARNLPKPGRWRAHGDRPKMRNCRNAGLGIAITI